MIMHLSAGNTSLPISLYSNHFSPITIKSCRHMIYILITPFRPNGLVLYMIPFTCYTTILLPVEHASKIFYLYQIFLLVEHLAALQLLSSATAFLLSLLGRSIIDYGRCAKICLSSPVLVCLSPSFVNSFHCYMVLGNGVIIRLASKGVSIRMAVGVNGVVELLRVIIWSPSLFR